MSGIISDNVGRASGLVKAAGGGGKLVQYVEATDGTAATITAQIPFDASIPQNDEGVELETLAITPTSATNKLIITWSAGLWSQSQANGFVYALYQDSTAACLRSWFADHWAHGSTWHGYTMAEHTMVAGTTSSTTFKIRGGPSGGYSMYHNSSGGTDLGLATSFSTLSIMEVEV